jgi:DNA ligase-1
MKLFTELFTALDQTTKTNAKLAALVNYFGQAPAHDAAWAVFFLSGERLGRLIPMKLLRQWSAETAGIEPWMFEECYEIVGDLAEVMALILPAAKSDSNVALNRWVNERLEPLRGMEEEQQREAVLGYWQELSKPECFVFHKLITGGFRVGVSKKTVAKALAKHSGIEPEAIAHRLMGNWTPSAQWFEKLLDPNTEDTELSRPYPFYLANPLEQEPDSLGGLSKWQAEWKWDGIRAQLIRRENETFIWSRGEDLMTDRFPELVEAANRLPNGTAIDGEIVGWKNGTVLPFSEMQRRIGWKKLGKKILADVPVSMIAFDLLEHDGVDVRERPLDWRRKKLESTFEIAASEPSNSSNPSNNIQTFFDNSNVASHNVQPSTQHKTSLAHEPFQLSKILAADSWDQLAQLRQHSREHQTEGLMLKQIDGPYRVGRPRGEWWKWKIEPYTVDAVLTYAQRGHGRRASLYTDYTFAVWDDDQLVTFAKAYSGLTDAEIRKVDRFVRDNTLQRFGPVRSVTPQLVFELAFENIQPSSRHKSGIAVRFPRISRWQQDLSAEDADSLSTIKSMMASQNSEKT